MISSRRACVRRCAMPSRSSSRCAARGMRERAAALRRRRPPSTSFEQKMSWILRLEDQRILRDRGAAAVAAGAAGPAHAAERRRRRAAAAAVPIWCGCSTTAKRASAAARRSPIGRVGLRDGVPPLVAAARTTRSRSAADGGVRARPDRRQRGAREPLIAALGDPSPLVQGSAAEALGLIGDAAAAAPIGADGCAGRAVGRARRAPGRRRRRRGAIRRRRPFRLASTRWSGSRPTTPLAAAVLDGAASRACAGGRWPTRCSASKTSGRLPALLTLAKEPAPYTRAFAAKGLGA